MYFGVVLVLKLWDSDLKPFIFSSVCHVRPVFAKL